VLHGLAVMPVCSTVLSLKPSIPSQKEAKALLEEHNTVGIVNDTLTSVTEPDPLVTAYPPQLKLHELVGQLAPDTCPA
jgi:hypothetical protein